VADIAVLVVDGVAGVQPQTQEAINHIKKAGISLIVAINKIDVPTANPEKIKQDLMKKGVQVESYGGKVPVVEVSAKTGKGIDQLLEMILLVAEMDNLQGDPEKPVEGVVIEAFLDSQKGPVATVILRQGSLNVGDVAATPTVCGRVKNIEDFKQESIDKALPSQPVIVLGFSQVPQVGDKFQIFPTMEQGELYVQKKEKKAGRTPLVFIEEGKQVLNLILKADVSGSLEAIDEVLGSLPQEKVVLRVLEKGVGDIDDNDVKLADASKAVILGFRVKIKPTTVIIQERQKIKMVVFDIIYDLAQAVRQLMENQLKAETEKKILGKIKVLMIFMTEKSRQIIGGKVIEGEVKKGAKLEIWREEQDIGRGRIVSLQENKKDQDSVTKGRECGILFEGTTKIQQGDILVAFTEEKVKAEL